MKLLLIAVIMFCFTFARAQGQDTEENELLAHMKKMKYWKYEADYKAYPNMQDSLEFESTLFGRMFYDYIYATPETMKKKLKS